MLNTMNIKGLKRRMGFGNVLFLISFFCLYGGGFLDNYGYILLMGYIVYMFLAFPRESSSVFFSHLMLPLYCFLLFYLLSSALNAKIVFSLFGKLAIIPLAIIHCKLLTKYPSLVSGQKWIIVAIFILISYFCIQAIHLLRLNPLAMRELISTNKDESIIVGGGFGLPYSLSLFLPTLLPIIKRSGVRSFLSLTLILFTILGITVILMSQYMTALMFLLFGYLLVSVIKYSRVKRIMLIIVGSILFFNLYMFLPDIFDMLGLTDLEMLYRRLDEVTSLASGSVQDATDFSSRIELSLTSLKTFSENILFGIGHKYDYHFGRMHANGVGMHAEWVDLLAQYGLFSILIFSYLIKGASKLHITKNSATVMFLFLGFFNPILSFQIVSLVYYLVPILYLVYSSNPQNYEDKRT